MKTELRSKKITARFTETEYKIIEELEQTFGISKTDIVRNRVLEHSGTAVINAKALIAELDKIGTELGRSGNNINQLARYNNHLKLNNVLAPDCAEKFNKLFTVYIDEQKILEAALRKVLRQLKT